MLLMVDAAGNICWRGVKEPVLVKAMKWALTDVLMLGWEAAKKQAMDSLSTGFRTRSHRSGSRAVSKSSRHGRKLLSLVRVPSCAAPSSRAAAGSRIPREQHELSPQQQVSGTQYLGRRQSGV